MGLFTSLLHSRPVRSAPAPERRLMLSAGAACCLSAVWPINPARAQTPAVQAHLDAARRAAGDDMTSWLQLGEALQPGFQRRPFDLAAAIKLPAQAPAKVFDNLYFLGTSWVNTWAITTSDGIVLIDAMNSDEEADRVVVAGMRQLGLDPSTIRTVVITHGHGDHYGGINLFRRNYQVRVALSDADWTMMETKLDFDNPLWGKPPPRDISLKHGELLRQGNTAIEIVLTPGHSIGTISPIFPVSLGGRSHLAMLWGGTSFNFGKNPARLQSYIDSAERARSIARERGVDVLISNHARFDSSLIKIAAMTPGKPNPFVIGSDAVQRGLTVMSECARATMASWT